MLVPTVMVVLSTAVLSDAPYRVLGLRSDLVLADAVVQVEALGGHCERELAIRPQKSGEIVRCEFARCAGLTEAGECNEPDQPVTLKVATQPLISIVLEAPDQTSELTRIFVLFEGDTKAVVESLIGDFGAADVVDIPQDNKSWSHARRWSWTQGQYRMGVASFPQMIVLATERDQGLQAEEASAVTDP
jgi:hypothetical protein